MRIPALLVAALAMLALAATALPAHAGHGHDRGPLRLDLVDRETGLPIQVHVADGERWIAGEPGHRYRIRLTNTTGRRLLAVVSVDGVNVVTGETASPGQSGYVLEPWASVDVDGWRKSLGEVAAFHFTALRHSYAARTGRPLDVGVIGVAVFEEARRWPRRPAAPLGHAEGRDEDHAGHRDRAGARSQAAPAAKAFERQDEALGTGHGAHEHAPARYTAFRRASRDPAQFITLRYDSLPRLVAAGIVPPPRWPHHGHHPRPFPGAFVPDPR